MRGPRNPIRAGPKECGEKAAAASLRDTIPRQVGSSGGEGGNGRVAAVTRAGGAGRSGAVNPRLGAWYFSYFAAAGVFLPYFSAFLLDRGFDARAIGALFAAMTVTKLLTPWVWGYAADRSGSRKRVVCLASVGAFLAFAAVSASSGFWTLFAALLVFGFFWQGALPQFEALTLARLGERASRYVHVRLWGSVGYVAAVIGVGALLERLAVSSVPFFVLGGLLLVLVASVAIPADAGSTSAPAPEGSDTEGRPPFPGWLVAFFLASLAMQASHGAFYAFFTPFLLEHGYRPTSIGLLWSLGVVCEIVLFAFFVHRWLERFPVVWLLLGCFAAAVVRWVATAALAGDPVWLTASQVLHAATFGLHHAVAMHVLRRAFRDRHLGRAQAVYASVSFGAGSAFGSLVAGQLWASFGGAAAFFGSAVLAALGAAIVCIWIRPALARGGGLRPVSGR